MDYMNPQGTLIIKVRDSVSGNIKKEFVQHNIITRQGDAYIADQLSLSPQRQKINSSNCYIVVGTGYTGTNNKNQTWVNTQVGNAQAVTATYPSLGGTWGNVGQNILNFNFVFPAGSLNSTGINEAAIVSAQYQGGATTCLAYAQLSSTDITPADSLEISWSINFSGQ